MVSLFFGTSVILPSQVVPDHPDLGLHGRVTWLTNTKIRVEYDWSDDSQLLDWTTTNGSMLLRKNGALEIRNGEAFFRTAVWKQLIKCTRIYAQNVKAIKSLEPSLIFITNVAGYTGYNSNPPGIIGIYYRSSGNLWIENGTSSSLWGPNVVSDIRYTINITIAETSISAQSSSDNIAYSHTLANPPDPDRQVVIGGWHSDTEWGNLTIEGEINMTLPTPADMLDIQTCGETFSPVIEITGSPKVEWIFNDGTSSSSTTPVKDYGSIGIRHNLLRVTPWSALTGINVGYDASNGGSEGYARVSKQNIFGFRNLSLAAGSLQFLCSSYSPLSDLDLTGFTELKSIELVSCYNLATLKLGTLPSLGRICVEDCNLLSVDLSGCPELSDYRGGSNRYPFINWGTTGAKIWYIGLGSNMQFTANLPDLNQFPMLKELMIWETNQSGLFVCHNSLIERIEADDNHITGVNLSGCTNLTELSLSGNKLTSLDLGTANNLLRVQLRNCYMPDSLTDYALKALDGAGLSDGALDLTGNAPPSPSGIVSYNNLRSKGWNVGITDPGQPIGVTEIILSGTDGATSINTEDGTLQLQAEIIPFYASVATVTWSITSGQRLASVDSTGLVTASANGTIIVRATSDENPEIYGELEVFISNQAGPEDDSLFSIGRMIVTQNELLISLNADFTSWLAKLYNLQGKLLETKYVAGNELIFDISKYTPGIYLIVLSADGKLKIAEFVKK